jgi:hypothetical protein
VTTKKRYREEHPCDECGKPTELQGWNFILGKDDTLENMKKEYRWWCNKHYLANMFGLWPYECSKACNARVAKKLECVPLEGDLWVWVQLERVVAANRPVVFKCPECTKPLKPVDIFKKKKKKKKG